MPSAWTAKRCRLRGTRRGVPVFERTRTCADLVDRHGAGLGVSARQLGRVGCHAAAHLAINPLPVLRTELGCFAALRGPEGLASPPLGGGLLGQARRPD